MRVKKITELNRVSLDQYKSLDKLPVVVVLDNIRSLNNIGSIFRSSDAFSVATLYLCGITAMPPHADIHKTALGAEDSVEWKYYEDTLDAVNQLKGEGFTICALEQTTGSTMLHEFKCEKGKKYAIVVGNEVKGVQQEVVDECHCAIEIPQKGTKHSLNVSIASGVILWELFRQIHID